MNITISKLLQSIAMIILILLCVLLILNIISWYKVYVCIISQQQPYINMGSRGFQGFLIIVGIILSTVFVVTGYTLRKKGL